MPEGSFSFRIVKVRISTAQSVVTVCAGRTQRRRFFRSRPLVKARAEIGRYFADVMPASYSFIVPPFNVTCIMA
jgi:hypothetical protein